jgi:hypothetical protein
VDDNVVKLAVAVLGLLSGLVALLTAVVGRRKEIVNRHEHIHRRAPAAGGASQGERPEVQPFACPECRGTDMARVRGVTGRLPRLLLAALLLIPIAWVLLAFYVASERQGGRDQNPIAILAAIAVALAPWAIVRRYLRAPLLRCHDCGTRVPPKDARV